MKDRSSNQKEELIGYLKRSILTMELRPGEDIDEVELSQKFGLSRTPLREILRELAGEGFIDLRANRGGRVADLSYSTLREFFLAAPMIYGAVLKLAAINATPEEINELKEAQINFKKSLQSASPEERALANNVFHEITGRMAKNTFLLPSFKRLLIDHARIGVTFYRTEQSDVKDNSQTASAHHDAIILAIEARDGHAAALMAQRHWDLSRDQIESFAMPPSLDFPLGSIETKPPNELTIK